MSPRGVQPWARAPALGVAISLGLGAVGCIIPDSGIVVDDEFLNPGAVRIVEPTPVTPRADEECAERTSLGGCPALVDTLPSGLIDPGFDLCVCPTGSRDLGLGAFDIFVEDPDVDDDGDPEDEILGVLLLDLPRDATDPSGSVAYTSLLPPDEPARRFRASDLTTIERPDPHLKAWTISGQPRVDLCNPDDRQPLQVGVHELRLIVTDRPWYRPVLLDEEGMVMLDEDGEPLLGEPVVGMPDLAAGASYDTTTYVFECKSGEGCNCES